MLNELNDKFNDYFLDYQQFLLSRGDFFEHKINFKQVKFDSELFEVNIFECEQIYSDSKRIFLVIPSIFNSPEILLFDDKNNFIKLLQKHGTVLLINWKEQSKQITFEDYVNEIIKLLEATHSKFSVKIDLVGHCIGGIISIGVAHFNIDIIRSLTLLTCPWDYSHFQPYMEGAEQIGLSQAIENFDIIPKIYFKILFFLLFPNQFNKKVEQYFLNDQITKRRQLHVEHWLQSGIDLSKAIFLEIKNKFVLENVLFEKKWQINNQIIAPEKFDFPVFLVSAKKDMIVPKESISRLTMLIKNSTLVEVEGGHINYLINNMEQLSGKYSKWLEYSG